jgi:CO/xanthine dehydrogenase Mo-binding subunit/CO/xanthine dehydrogenase FAD-binding subunit
MRPFAYVRADDPAAAVALVSSDPTAAYLAGGTTELDLVLKDGVLDPGRLVDITRLPLRGISRTDDTLRVGALVTMNELAADPTVGERVPFVREALLAGASPQLRNMATIGGNLLQRTRCRYFRDPAVPACNKRAPGSGCAAVRGPARMHAILGAGEDCIALHASDLCVPLVALDTLVDIQDVDGSRCVPLTRFYVLPGARPDIENVLRHGELITRIHVPLLPAGMRSGYLKVRDRASYEFALTSAAAALQIEDGTIVRARLALGGVGTMPWRAFDAEEVLHGAPATGPTFRAAAEAAPGVLAVITHANAPALVEGPMTPLGASAPFPLEDSRIQHYGQHVAVVVARTREHARAAARLVEIDYEAAAPILAIDDPRAPMLVNRWGQDVDRGNVSAALASADVVYDESFTTAAVTPNPMGLFATVARWEGDRLTVHDSSQDPMLVRKTLATVFSLEETDVRVLVPYIGGAFGAGLRTWPHVILTALASRVVGRPVKLVLTRPQMFTSVGHRPESRQRVRLGATRDGRLVAVDHDGTSTLGALDDGGVEPVTLVTGNAYACPNVATHDRRARLHIPSPHWMRGPGTTQGNFAVESALDELSYALAIDPIELRLRNYAEVHPGSGRPWSSKALRECYRAGAERFGWARRTPAIGSMRDGNWLVGHGMAGVTFTSGQARCEATVSIRADGTAHVRSAATDLGTGTYTIASQVTAELLGLDIDRVEVEIGDSDLPFAPYSGGSGMATSLSGAIHDAVGNLVRAFRDLGADDEPYADILARHRLPELTAHGERDPQATERREPAANGSFAAWFAEVRVDADLGLLRVARIVAAVDAGRILNEKLARSQMIGGAVMGIGMTMLEETVSDPETGRIVNATFGDYLIPANADVPDLDVVFVGTPDTVRPLGIKGIGEISGVGLSAAIADGVYHATGRRIRSLPITVEQLV